jgi:hypothetical protein
MRVVLPYHYPYLLPSTNYPYVPLLPRAVCVRVFVLCVCVCVCAVDLLMHWLLASRVPPPMEYRS